MTQADSNAPRPLEHPAPGRVMERPEPRRASPTRVYATWGIAGLLFFVIAALQQIGVHGEPKSQAANLESGITIEPPGIEQKLLAKIAVMGKEFFAPPAPGGTGQSAPSLPGPNIGQTFQMYFDLPVGWEPPGGVGDSPFAAAQAGVEIKPNPKIKASASDRLRVAIMAGEALGGEASANRLDALRATLDESSALLKDIEIVRAVYGVAESEAQDAVKALSVEQVAAFKDHHGLFADLALARGESSSAIRSSLASEGTLLMLLILLAGFYFLCAFLTGVVLGIIGIVRLSGGKLRMRLGAQITNDELRNPYRVLMVETVAVFLAAFLGLQLLLTGIKSYIANDDLYHALQLGGQWLVALTILWPVVRGMPGRQWREYVGLIAPRGVWREVGAGLAGYYALLPVYVLVALVVIAIMFVISALTGAPPVPRNNGGKIAEVFGSSNPLIVLLVLTLATMWAPLVEETIFRGTLFRYWRARAGLFWGALGSAAVFAGMHGYIPMQLFMVGSLGFGFALIREWRGSIVGCMTAHCLHNAVVSVVMALILSLAA